MEIVVPEGLKTTLSEAGIDTDHATIERVSARMHRLVVEHRNREFRFGRGLAKASQELRDLYMALATWLRSNSGECVFEQTLLNNYDGGENFKPAYRLLVAIQDVINQREAEWSAHRQEASTTTLMLEMYYLYVELTGEYGLSDGGPAYRFVSECVKLYISDFVVKKKGFADLLRKADARRKKQGNARC